MDPNAALDGILTNYLIADHAEALAGWLAREGFAPAERTLPEHARCPVFIRAHVARHYPGADFESIRVRADRAGLWTAPPAGQWISLAIWPDLMSADDDECDEQSE
jgi:hypothetical protein